MTEHDWVSLPYAGRVSWIRKSEIAAVAPNRGEEGQSYVWLHGSDAEWCCDLSVDAIMSKLRAFAESPCHGCLDQCAPDATPKDCKIATEQRNEMERERDGARYWAMAKNAKFIAHIQAHLAPGEKVICKICGKTAEEICR